MSEFMDGFLGKAESIPRRVMAIFFLIDTSGSMSGEKIGAVNAAMEELLPDLQELSDSNADAEIKVAIMKFSTGCEWITPALVSLESYGEWEPLYAEGLTDLGQACRELNSKLSQSNGFMNRNSDSSGFYKPVLFLLSDGSPTDDYENGMKELQKNKWYQSAIKIAIAIGDEVDKNVLKQFTKNVELVIPVNNTGVLRKVIRFAAVTSSQIASTSTSATSSDEVYKQSDVKDVTSKMAEKQLAEKIDVFKREVLQDEEDIDFSLNEDNDEFYINNNTVNSVEDISIGSNVSDDDDDDFD